jgi:hypothetical protein
LHLRIGLDAREQRAQERVRIEREHRPLPIQPLNRYLDFAHASDGLKRHARAACDQFGEKRFPARIRPRGAEPPPWLAGSAIATAVMRPR